MITDYQKYFQTFTEVSKAIHSGTSTSDIIKSIVNHITDIMEATGCIYWIINNESRKIETRVSFGFNYRSLSEVDFDTLLTIFEPNPQKMTFIEDCRYDERIPNLERLGKKRIVSVVGMAFEIVDQYSGILAVYFGRERELSQSETDFLKALGEQGAIALHKSLRYDEKMLKMFRQTVEGLALALEAKDTQTHGHSLKVACYARLTAEALGQTEKQIETVYHAGLLHDIGKINTRDKILSRLGKLSSKEMNAIKKHPEIGAKILKPLSFLGDVVPLILYHHERFDGSGYPEGKKGEDIPLGARILAVCDSFETMISGRANMERIDPLDAVIRLKKCAGTLFDPVVTDALISSIKSNPEVVESFSGTKLYFGNEKYGIDPFDEESISEEDQSFKFPPSF